MPWLALALLAVIGAAVLAARTLGRPPSAEPTPTSPLNSLTPVRTPPTPVGTPPGGTSVPAAAATKPLEPAAAPLATLAQTSPPKTPTPVITVHPTATSPVNGPTPVRSPTPQPPTVAQPSPTPTPLVPVTGPTLVRNAPSVALTFDAGADRGYALDILDVLQQERVVASFGITGNWAKANPDLVQRMAADGHLVFNHTLDHRSFTGVSDKLGGLSAAARRAELDDADLVIAPLIGRSTRPYYRLPYGDDDARVASDVESAGFTHKIGWTVDSLGWRGIQSVDIVARCLKLAAPGAVYVLHVGRASQDALALPQIIHALRDRGYAFHRVDQA